jgi:hypothetical protein
MSFPILTKPSPNVVSIPILTVIVLPESIPYVYADAVADPRPPVFPMVKAFPGVSV